MCARSWLCAGERTGSIWLEEAAGGRVVEGSKHRALVGIVQGHFVIVIRVGGREIKRIVMMEHHHLAFLHVHNREHKRGGRTAMCNVPRGKAASAMCMAFWPRI
jgi:hypothetical protein